MNNYTIIHLHSDLSSGVTNIDSVTKFEDYIHQAQEFGMKALAFTEHGNVFSWLKKKEKIEAAGMKYIHGIEAYVTEQIDPENKVRDNYHVIMLAKNYDGVKEINKLSSKSFNRNDGHFYYAPRISMDELLNTSDNIIITTACLGGILNGGTDHIKETFITFLTQNRHRCFLEIQPHIDPDQVAYNQYLVELSKATGVELIAGTDTHALNELHVDARSVLQKGKGVHFENEDRFNLVMMDRATLEQEFAKQKAVSEEIYKSAIDKTNEVADMVEEFEIDRSYKYPNLWEDSEGTLRAKIKEGIKRRGIESYPNYQEYLDRIENELETYRHNGAFDFILLMDDVIQFCRDNNIPIGWGRGSVTGSIVCWLLGITEMDSIKFHLSFERFMNTERVSLADIDTDVPPSRIPEIKEYLFHKHGLYCSDIITFNTNAEKGAIDDICRAIYPKETYQKTASEIKTLLESDPDKARKQYPDIFKYVDLISGVIVSIGNHPCGVVVSPEPLDDALGLCTSRTDKYQISQLNMKEVDSLNFVKLDLLKLDTAEIITNTCKLANIPLVTPDNLDVDDDDVWNSMREDTTQVFQWEGQAGEHYIRKLLSDDTIAKFKALDENVDRMTLITIGNSAIRPAGASYRNDLANGVVRSTGSEAIDEFLKPTFGYLVFQEQIIFFLNRFCGFTMGQADIVRRGFAKKTGTDQYIPQIKQGFIETTMRDYGFTKEKAEQDIVAFLQVIEDASSYLFSENHSVPYSYTGYAEAWLRYHYPVEFLTCALHTNIDDAQKTAALTKYIHQRGIKIVAPQFRHSKSDYFCDSKEKVIYKGVRSVKSVGKEVGDRLYKLRDRKYDSFIDCLYDIRYGHKGAYTGFGNLKLLVQIDFFTEFGDQAKLLKLVEMFELLDGKQSQSYTNAPDELKPLLPQYCESYTTPRVEEIDVERYIADYNIPAELSEKCIKYKYIKNGDERTKVSNGYSTKKAIKVLDIPEHEQWTYATKIVDGRYQNIKTHGLLNAYEKQLECEPRSITDKIRSQLDYLGYVDITDPNMSWRAVVVNQLETKYTPRFKAYSLRDGRSLQMCIRKEPSKYVRSQFAGWDTMQTKPVQEGDIIYIGRWKKLPKQRKTDDGFEVVPGEFNYWVSHYTIIKTREDEALLYEN